VACLAGHNWTGKQIQRLIQQTRRRFRSNSGIVIDLPSRPIRIDVNSVGLLARASSDGSCLPSALLRQWRTRFAPPRLQWRGRSGFAPDSHTKNRVVRLIRQAVEASQAFLNAQPGGITKRRSSRAALRTALAFPLCLSRAPESDNNGDPFVRAIACFLPQERGSG
jgi:hypothetical protein